jgi:hypothetical protein
LNLTKDVSLFSSHSSMNFLSTTAILPVLGST